MIKRIIAAPFVFCIVLVDRVFNVFQLTYLFIKYGGEWISHVKKDKATIHKIYHELVKQQETKGGNND